MQVFVLNGQNFQLCAVHFPRTFPAQKQNNEVFQKINYRTLPNLVRTKVGSVSGSRVIRIANNHWWTQEGYIFLKANIPGIVPQQECAISTAQMERHTTCYCFIAARVVVLELKQTRIFDCARFFYYYQFTRPVFLNRGPRVRVTVVTLRNGGRGEVIL